MNTLTDKQKELLLSNKEDLKVIVIAFWNHQPLTPETSFADDFDSFASQFERKPRFVTNGDGEEIFDGEEYHFVSTVIPYKIFTENCSLNSGKDMGNKSYFKSKEKAEKYITLNAPRLSVNDVMKVVGQYVFDPSFYKDKLISLVKSKL